MLTFQEEKPMMEILKFKRDHYDANNNKQTHFVDGSDIHFFGCSTAGYPVNILRLLVKIKE